MSNQIPATKIAPTGLDKAAGAAATANEEAIMEQLAEQRMEDANEMADLIDNAGIIGKPYRTPDPDPNAPYAGPANLCPSLEGKRITFLTMAAVAGFTAEVFDISVRYADGDDAGLPVSGELHWHTPRSTTAVALSKRVIDNCKLEGAQATFNYLCKVLNIKGEPAQAITGEAYANRQARRAQFIQGGTRGPMGTPPANRPTRASNPALDAAING